jgi:CheY-like chemotaxis protein
MRLLMAKHSATGAIIEEESSVRIGISGTGSHESPLTLDEGVDHRARASSAAHMVGEHRVIRPPSAETGVIAAVKITAEDNPLNERQDATRTIAETRPVPMSAKINAVQRETPLVLVVEDTLELAEVIQATLRRMSVQTIHESHGSRVFNHFAALPPEVILLDINLPDITGWKVLEGIKERSKEMGVNMPAVIVITAYGDAANRLVGKLQGVHSYLVKPFTPDEVERVVRNALAKPTA